MNSFITKEEILEKPRDDCPKVLPEVPSLLDTPLKTNDKNPNKLEGTI